MKPLLPAVLPLFLLPAPLAAQELAFPFPVMEVAAEPPEYDSYALPVGGWAGGTLPTHRVEGMVDRRAWRLDAAGQPLLAIMAPLRDQLLAQGYQVLFDCETRSCGGFDFRFATEVLPEPAMHVDLGEFRFVSALRGDQVVGLLVSRSANAGFVQMISVGPEPLAPVVAPGPTEPLPPSATPEPAEPAIPSPLPVPADLVARLDAGLPVALDDLVFASGAAALADGEFASLSRLAEWLRSDPGRAVVLVGHTDSSGSLDANVELSLRRAEAVRQVLISRMGVAGGQIKAEGVGPLAPRDTNLTEEGRRNNRRVEAIVAPTRV